MAPSQENLLLDTGICHCFHMFRLRSIILFCFAVCSIRAQQPVYTDILAIKRLTPKEAEQKPEQQEVLVLTEKIKKLQQDKAKLESDVLEGKVSMAEIEEPVMEINREIKDLVYERRTILRPVK